jgi:hypothetical protein
VLGNENFLSLKKRQKNFHLKKKKNHSQGRSKKEKQGEIIARKTYLLMIPIKRVCLFKQRNFLFQDFEGISGI